MADIGRPKIEIDFRQLKALMRLKPRLEDAAAMFLCSTDTIERRIRENTVSDEFPEGLTFAEFRDQNMVHTRFSIIRKIVEKAQAGDNVMLIYASKNLCDWNDGKTPDVNVNVQNVNNIKEEDLDKRIAEFEAKRAQPEPEQTPEPEETDDGTSV